MKNNGRWPFVLILFPRPTVISFSRARTKKDTAQKLKRNARYSSQVKMLLNICNFNGINMPVMALALVVCVPLPSMPANESKLFHNFFQYDCYYYISLISHLPLAALQRFQMKISSIFTSIISTIESFPIKVAAAIAGQNTWIESIRMKRNPFSAFFFLSHLFIFISRFLSSHFIFVLIFKLQWMKYFPRFVFVLFIERYCSRPCCVTAARQLILILF